MTQGPQQAACPNCGGVIAHTAIICHHCKYNLRTGRAGPAPSGGVSKRGSSASSDRYSQFAMAAWGMPLGAVLLLCLGGCLISDRLTGMGITVLCALLILGGIGSGIYALTGTGKRGPEGVLVPAILGLVLGGVLLIGSVFMLPGVMRARAAASLSSSKTLVEARAGHTTKLLRQEQDGTPVDVPPRGMLNLVKYKSPVGELAAYVSPNPQDGRKHPAIVWLVGGFDNSIGDVFWTEADPEDDQSASAFRAAGIITMYPSLRGGNKNPGNQENFYGEVDDVIAAGDYLRTLPYVDPNRIYLGGHSTGGTLALLVAESTDRFRCIFAFGPVSSPAGYGSDALVYDPRDSMENTLRSPGVWLKCIANPTFVIEGNSRDANIRELRKLQNACKNQLVQFHAVNGVDHFSILAPATAAIAQKIITDTQPQPSISFSDTELLRPVRGLR